MTANAPIRTRPKRRSGDPPIPYVWSYGMGAESTAGIHRMLTDLAARPAALEPDFANLVVLIAQTGDEWSTTGALVEEHILPLLCRHRVRVVEVARAGPSAKDGVAVLQDSREPQRLHLDGAYKLSVEHRHTGTQPQLGGVRKCSLKAKGAPLDAWRAAELGDARYFHAVGFNRDEETRVARDRSYAMGGRRLPVYPVYEWGWSRQDCVEHLLRAFGVVWPKSCCRQCPFAGCGQGWPDQLARFRALPGEAVQHVVDEYVCLALNPRSGLFGPGRSLTSRLRRDGAGEVVDLAVARMVRVPWAVYRVRRCYSAPASAFRSVERLLIADRQCVGEILHQAARLVHSPVVRDAVIPGSPRRHADTDVHSRLWLRQRSGSTYPQIEEFYVPAPAQALDKTTTGFRTAWTAATDPTLTDVEHHAAEAFALASHAAGVAYLGQSTS